MWPLSRRLPLMLRNDSHPAHLLARVINLRFGHAVTMVRIVLFVDVNKQRLLRYLRWRLQKCIIATAQGPDMISARVETFHLYALVDHIRRSFALCRSSEALQ